MPLKGGEHFAEKRFKKHKNENHQCRMGAFL